MFALLLASVAFGAESFTFEAPLIDQLLLEDDFDHQAFKADARELDGELAALLATPGWSEVQSQGPRAPVLGSLAFVRNALSVQPAFVATARTGRKVGDDYELSMVSNAKVLRDAQGRVRAAAGGITTDGGECGGSWTTYSDWLVTYDADGSPDRVYLTANQYGAELVRHTSTIGQVQYEGGLPVALDVQSRERWIGCDLCENGLLTSDDWDDVSWSHVRYVFVHGDTDVSDAEGC